MDLGMLAKGAVLGFSIAAPVGPIGVLCIRRTLAEGRWHGVVSGLGAATADAAYGAMAAFGLTALSGWLLDVSFWLKLGGGLFLCYLGLRTLLAAPAERAAAHGPGTGLARAYLSTVLLTLTNPATILSFLAMFAGAGLGGGSSWEAATIVAGVFGGSALWWLLLSSGVGLFGERLGSRGLRWVNRISGVVLLTFGALALLGVRS